MKPAAMQAAIGQQTPAASQQLREPPSVALKVRRCVTLPHLRCRQGFQVGNPDPSGTAIDVGPSVKAAVSVGSTQAATARLVPERFQDVLAMTGEMQSEISLAIAG